MKFTIPNIYFVILIGITTVYLTFLTAKGGLTDSRYHNVLKRLTFRGKIVLSILLFMLLLLALQEINNQNLSYNKDLELKKETNKRDSIITSGIKSGVSENRKKLFGDLSNAFAKQNLKLDTLENTIIRIKDSTNIVNNFVQDDPVLLIPSNGIEYISDEKNFKISLRSSVAGSSNFDIICYLLTKYKDGYDLTRFNLFPDYLKIPKDSNWETWYSANHYDQIEIQYIYLIGKYTTVDKSKSYIIDDVYENDISKKKVCLLYNTERKKVLDIIRSVPETSFQKY